MTGLRALRDSILRAAGEIPGLDLAVERSEERRLSLAELLEVVEMPALLGVLSGPREALGMAALSPGLVASVVEARMAGRVFAGEPEARRVTATDAMLVGSFLDDVLEKLTAQLACEEDVVWAGGFHHASHLDDPRPLGLMLDEGSYRLLTVTVAAGDGHREGRLTLALPAAGRGAPPQTRLEPVPERKAVGVAWTRRFGESVGHATAELDAVLARLDLTLATVAALQPGMSIPLGKAAIDRVAITGIDGRVVAEARLGQAQGFRALRIREPEAAPGLPPP